MITKTFSQKEFANNYYFHQFLSGSILLSKWETADANSLQYSIINDDCSYVGLFTLLLCFVPHALFLIGLLAPRTLIHHVYNIRLLLFMILISSCFYVAYNNYSSLQVTVC